MFNQIDIQQLFLKHHPIKKKWQQLLSQSGIEQDTTQDYQQLDKTLGLYADDELVGTVSCQSNMIKYIAISEKYKCAGSTFNVLVSAIIHEMNNQELFHYVVFTKKQYKKSFESLGFKPIVLTNKIVALEKGNWSIDQYLTTIPQGNGGKKAAIVMNANPFTTGHYYLIEQAASENDWVYVFVLQKEQSLFSTETRLSLVQKGTEQLANVTVVSGDEYVISPATFPTYFLRKNDEIAKEQMIVDATLFKEKIAKYLNITTRYVGEEPLSPMTHSYNQVLQTILSPEIAVVVIPRKKTKKNQVISASQIREAFLNGRLDEIQEMVPEVTYHYLLSQKEK